MSVRRSLVKGVAVVGALGASLLTARGVLAERAAARFYEHGLPRTEPRQYGRAYGGAPLVFHRSEGIQTFHAASLDAISAALPTDELYPVRTRDGRAIVVISGYQYHSITANGVDGLALLPYAALTIGVLVTRRPAPPMLPFFAPGFTGLTAGAFVFHMPETNRMPVDAGRIANGFPKFVADFDIHDSTRERRYDVAEGGRAILSLAVRGGGRPALRTGKSSAYTVRGDELIEQAMPYVVLRQRAKGSGAGRVELGVHPISDELRAFDLDPTALQAETMTNLRFCIPLGTPIGYARPYEGYTGEDRDFGRYVVHYPDTKPIDQHAPFAPTAGPVEVAAGVRP